MIAIAKKNKTNKTNKHSIDEKVNAKFLELMPKIVRKANIAFMDYGPDRKEDAVQSVLVTSFLNIKQLAAKGRLDDAYASPIARFAIMSYRCGHVGGIPDNSKDVLNDRCRYVGRSKVEYSGLALDITDSYELETTATDSRYPVDKTVQLRIDYAAWCRSLSPVDRKIVKDLAKGETTNNVATKYGVAASTVSTWRRWYADSWNDFIDPQEEIDELENIDALV